MASRCFAFCVLITQVWIWKSFVVQNSTIFLCLSIPLSAETWKIVTRKVCQIFFSLKLTDGTGKNNGFPFLDFFGYLKNTHKNPKFGKVRQVPTREFPTKFPDWDLSHSSKFGIFVGILTISKNIQKWESVIFSCVAPISLSNKKWTSTLA